MRLPDMKSRVLAVDQWSWGSGKKHRCRSNRQSTARVEEI